MLEQNFWIISTALNVIGGICAFFAAFVGFIAVLKSGKQEGERNWFRKVWERINQNRWVEMPEQVIEAIILGKGVGIGKGF